MFLWLLPLHALDLGPSALTAGYWIEAPPGRPGEPGRFVSRRSGGILEVSGSGTELALRPPSSNSSRSSPSLSVRLLDANPSARVETEEALSFRVNYFLGQDPAAWRPNLTPFGVVRCRDVYPGVDWIHFGNPSDIEFDFLLAPGADPHRIRLRFEGATAVEPGANGELVVHAGEHHLRFRAPRIYQRHQGQEQIVSGGFVLRSGGDVGFSIGPYDSSAPLLIDPVLDYSTFLGGNANEGAHGIAVDASGAAYITGWTQSNDIFDRGSVFVVKVNPGGTRFDYVSFIGGTDLDQGLGIAVDGAGNAYVVGYTTSADFPVANPVQPTLRGFSDAFVFKLNPAGDRLLYATYLGGSDGEINTFPIASIVAAGAGIAVDDAGHAYVVGSTASTDFPATANAFQRALADMDPFAVREDAFVAKLAADGRSLVYSSYLGGSGRDRGLAIAVDATGQAHVTGATAAANFPAVKALVSRRIGAGEIPFVSKISASGSELLYSTGLVGNGQGNGIAVDSAGAIYVGGMSRGGLPTTPGVFQDQPHPSTGEDGFVLKLSPAGDSVLYSTYLGGANADAVRALALQGRQATVVGGTRSSPDRVIAGSGFPLRNALQTNDFGLDENVFVVQLNETGDAIYSTTLGGSLDDVARAVAVDGHGAVFVAGDSESTDFPTHHPIQPGSVDWEVIITKISDGATATGLRITDPNASRFGQRFYRARLLDGP